MPPLAWPMPKTATRSYHDVNLTELNAGFVLSVEWG
jgi:hypothetical protein